MSSEDIRDAVGELLDGFDTLTDPIANLPDRQWKAPIALDGERLTAAARST